jgi:Protein of unknown function (DUF2752)
MTMPQPNRPGLASAAVGTLLLAQIAATGVLLRASQDGVWLLGHPFGGVCLFQRLTGVPCPTCGMTRSIVLTLSGHLATALRLNLAGPVWVLTAATLAMALLWLAWRERARGANRSTMAQRRVRLLVLVQGAVFAVALAANWIWVLRGRR